MVFNTKFEFVISFTK